MSHRCVDDCARGEHVRCVQTESTWPKHPPGKICHQCVSSHGKRSVSRMSDDDVITQAKSELIKCDDIDGEYGFAFSNAIAADLIALAESQAAQIEAIRKLADEAAECRPGWKITDLCEDESYGRNWVGSRILAILDGGKTNE